jgi:hypothetical protein
MQTIFVAAPGFQSIDAWLPLAIKHKESSKDDIFIVFPYLWVLELIPECDALVRIMIDNKFRVVCKFAPSKFFIVFENLSYLIQYVRMIEHFKSALIRKRLIRTTIFGRIKSFQKGISAMSCFRSIRMFKFDSQGVMVWDILNLNPEPYKRLQSLLLKTKLWKRISINVGAIYVEDVSVDALCSTSRDYQVSFSKQQTILMTSQYGLENSNIIESKVPKFDQNWIEYLESYSLLDYKFLDSYALLVSRGEDPPLLESVQRINVLEEVINQICEKRKMLLLIKLHPNERQESFDLDIEQIAQRDVVGKEAISRVLLVHDHIIVAAKYAKYGFAYYSSTIADMVRVGCPAIQVLPILSTDSQSLVKSKLLFDLGFIELVPTIDSLAKVLTNIDSDRNLIKTAQAEAWSHYFFPTTEFSVSDFT